MQRWKMECFSDSKNNSWQFVRSLTNSGMKIHLSGNSSIWLPKWIECKIRVLEEVVLSSEGTRLSEEIGKRTWYPWTFHSGVHSNSDSLSILAYYISHKFWLLVFEMLQSFLKQNKSALSNNFNCNENPFAPSVHREQCCFGWQQTK